MSDMAEFTGATETIPLGKKANKEAAEKMRSGMIDMIQDVAEDEEDEEARQWEEAQIKRGEQRRGAAVQVRRVVRALLGARLTFASYAGSVKTAIQADTE